VTLQGLKSRIEVIAIRVLERFTLGSRTRVTAVTDKRSEPVRKNPPWPPLLRGERARPFFPP